MSAITFLALEERVATWRTIWPAQELRRRGHDVKVYAKAAGEWPARPETDDDVTYIFHVVNKAWTHGSKVITCLDLADIFVSAGRLILSIDDDWTRMLEVQEPNLYARRVWEQIPEMAAKAERVIVATPRLAEVFGQFNPDVVVVENYLPEWVLDLPRKPRLDVVAWLGEMYLHGQDWNDLQDYAADLPPLRLIGSGKEAAERIRSWGAREVGATPVQLDQRKLYMEAGRAVAAIVPLSDTAFNRGKSWSKPMEFAARGVLPVCSWHDEYVRLQTLFDQEAKPAVVRGAEGLVEMATFVWENRAQAVIDGDALPEGLRDAGAIMEQTGGDQWEKAIV